MYLYIHLELLCSFLSMLLDQSDRHQCNRCGDKLGLFDGEDKVADGALVIFSWKRKSPLLAALDKVELRVIHVGAVVLFIVW